MKLLIGLLCAIGLSGAYAQEYSSANKGGGEIRLTFQKCHNNNKARPFMAYYRGPDGRAGYGCWDMVGEQIHVRWDDGDNRIYEGKFFHEVPNTSTQSKKGNDI